MDSGRCGDRKSDTAMDGGGNMSTPEPIAWRVNVNGIKLIVFSTTESKAKWKAAKALDGDGWPSISIERAPEHDKSYLRNRPTLSFEETL